MRHIEFALLLVVIKEARRCVEVFGIGVERGASLVEEFAQILRFAQQIEITLDQLRIPERLKSLLVNRKAFAHRALAIFDHRFRFHGEDLVVGKLLAVIGNEFSGGSVLFLRNQELEKTRVDRGFLRIAANPVAVLGDGDFFWQALFLNDAENTVE